MIRTPSTFRVSAPHAMTGRRHAAVAFVLAAAFATGAAGAPERSGSEVAKSQCARCHDAGTANAPKPGDKAAWAPRLSRGVEVLVSSAIRGHGGMPPRGGKADLTDNEIRSALLYMFDPAGPPKAPPKSAPAPILAGAGLQRAAAGGLDIYFGRISAEAMRAYPPGSPEAKLHGGVPSGSGYHHVNVSLFDAASQAQVAGASVELDIEQLGMGRETKKLESVTLVGGVSYSAYVRLAPKGNYTFVVRVSKPGSSKPVEATFRERLN
jgi:cytochrome c5